MGITQKRWIILSKVTKFIWFLGTCK